MNNWILLILISMSFFNDLIIIIFIDNLIIWLIRQIVNFLLKLKWILNHINILFIKNSITEWEILIITFHLNLIASGVISQILLLLRMNKRVLIIYIFNFFLFFNNVSSGLSIHLQCSIILISWVKSVFLYFLKNL